MTIDALRLSFAHPERLPILPAAALLCALLLYLELKRSEGLLRMLSPAMQARLCRRLPRARQGLRRALLPLCLLLGAAALCQPQSPGDIETVSAATVSADIMVVLDVSRSMLAEDAAPSRLHRAKAEIRDLLGQMKGHRLGLVAFAGRAQVLCPLTPDYGFFRMILDGAGPASISRGGTRIGDGLRAALSAFETAGSGAGRLILLITDGEDHDSYPKEAAERARAAGVRVVSIGFGDERGSEVPITDPASGGRRFLTDRDGQLVRTRLMGQALRDIALATEGAYIPAGVAALDLPAIVREHIQPILRARPDAAAQARVVPREWYPALLALALLALVGWAALGRVPL